MAGTAGIKQRLNIHRKMVEEYDSLQQELKIAVEKYGGLQGVRYDTMSKGGSRTGNGRIENVVIRKIELEDLLKSKNAKIESDWSEIEGMLTVLKPTEALIIRLRYRYAMGWEELCKKLYGNKSDYDAHKDSYMNRIFNAHGRALLSLAEIYT